MTKPYIQVSLGLAFALKEVRTDTIESLIVFVDW